MSKLAKVLGILGIVMGIFFGRYIARKFTEQEYKMDLQFNVIDVIDVEE